MSYISIQHEQTHTQLVRYLPLNNIAMKISIIDIRSSSYNREVIANWESLKVTQVIQNYTSQ